MNPVDQSGPHRGKALVHYQGTVSAPADKKSSEESRAELGSFV